MIKNKAEDKRMLLFLGQHTLDKLDGAPRVRTYYFHRALKEKIPTIFITGSRTSRTIPLLKMMCSPRMRIIRYLYLEPSTSASTPVDLGFLIAARFFYRIPVAIYIRDVHQLFGRLYSRNTFKRVILYYGWLLSMAVYRRTADILYFPAEEMSDYIHFKNKKVLPPGGILRETVKRPSLQSLKMKTIVYMGGNNYFYGIDLFVKAMAEVVQEDPNVKCLLLSKGNFSYLERLRHAPWLEIRKTTFKEIPKYLKDAYLGVSCLRKSEYGSITIALKLFDYMSYRLPILATRCGPQTRFIEENRCGLLVDDTVDSIAKGIRYMLKHPRKVEMWGEHGYHCLKEKHLWKHRAEQLLKDFEDLENR